MGLMCASIREGTLAQDVALLSILRMLLRAGVCSQPLNPVRDARLVYRSLRTFPLVRLKLSAFPCATLMVGYIAFAIFSTRTQIVSDKPLDESV